MPTPARLCCPLRQSSASEQGAPGAHRRPSGHTQTDLIVMGQAQGAPRRPRSAKATSSTTCGLVDPHGTPLDACTHPTSPTSGLGLNLCSLPPLLLLGIRGRGDAGVRGHRKVPAGARPLAHGWDWGGRQLVGRLSSFSEAPGPKGVQVARRWREGESRWFVVSVLWCVVNRD